MAKFSFETPVDFLKQLGKLSEIDKVAPKMIDGAMPLLTPKLIKEVGLHQGTGELQASIKATKAKASPKGGFFATSRPTGKSYTYVGKNGKTYYRKELVDNMAKLAYLEYGTSKQDAKPVMATVMKDSEADVLDKMQEIFNKENDAE